MSENDPQPLVSVVIPAFNPGRLISDAIESVLAQSYRNFEIIVVDDASTDGFHELLKSLQFQVLYIRQAHAGSAVARNRGVLLSGGEYIAFLDADDLWVPAKLEKQVDFMERNRDAVLTYADFSKSPNPNEEPEVDEIGRSSQ